MLQFFAFFAFTATQFSECRRNGKKSLCGVFMAFFAFQFIEMPKRTSLKSCTIIITYSVIKYCVLSVYHD